ncbi:MAG TPA: FIST N-terminal domain-containing protein [Minicystis sp.]|nr:FIST N-terminal domain-containing protein [Minicystis sp.]
MSTHIATALASGHAREAADQLVAKARQDLGGVQPQLVVVFASTAQPLAEIVGPVADAFRDAVLIGASTAGEFTERGDAKGSTSLFALAGDYRVHAGMGTGLKDAPERAVEQALEGLPKEVTGYPHRTAILLLDPLAGNGEEATLIASSMLGADVRLAGGAAGDDLHMEQTVVSAGRRAASDAIVLAMIFSKTPLGVGASHGHRPVSQPLRVTKASGNVVREIENRPAWDVWIEQTRARAAEQGIDVGSLKRGEEGSYLLRYEAGLAAGADAFKIRAPLSRADDGSISFACGIPEGSVIRITESVAARQIESAREAARRARAQLGGNKPAGAIVFDCICRNLILGDAFSTAVRGISEELGGARVAGFETYGEIALDVGDMSGFHNTTSVVLAFPES